MIKSKKLIFVDVEAVGISPVNGAMTEFGAVDYETRKTYHGVIWQAMPDPTNPAKSIRLGTQPIRGITGVMLEFNNWLDDLGKQRPVFVSDNPAYDFQWINCAFDEAGMDNPFGHSGRRISDFWAGVNNKWSETQSWKRFRKTPHDHNPVNDAMGNVEAFERILAIVEERKNDR